MGFLDKAKEAAERATVMAQEGLSQGQSKLDDFQTKRDSDALFRDLGELFYAEQRSGGDHEVVVAKLAELDRWHQQQAAQPGSSPAGEQSRPGPSPAGEQSRPGSSPPPDAPTGNFTLDD